MSDRGQGRKPLPPEEKTKPRSNRLTDARWEMLKLLHKADPDWLNKAIDKAAKKLKAIDKAKEPRDQQKENE